MHQAALQPGYLLQEYKILRLLGEGGFGLTYLAFDTQLEKKVAIKEYFPSEFAVRKNGDTVRSKSDSTQSVFNWGLKSFLNEAKLLAQFNHPNIVRVHRFFEANGTAFLVMEFLNGGSLADLLEKSNSLNYSEVKNILKPIIGGLQKVHEKGVLHRDIKPENIMFDENKVPVLIDFGASRYAVSEKTNALTTLYTPGYAPLEQYGSDTKIGPWTDIYSLAAVAYRCLTGENPPNVMDRVNQDKILTLAKHIKPMKFIKSIDKALAITGDDRPQSLSAWVSNWEETAKPQSENTILNTQLNAENPFDDKRQKPFKNPVLFFLTALLVVGAMSFFMYQNRDKQQIEFVKKIVKDTAKPETNDVVETESRQALAVMPFESINIDLEDEFFVRGVHDNLITQLSKIQSLSLISQGSMITYQNSDKDFKQIGEELNVQHLVTGTIQKGGDRVRVNAKLFRTANNELVWAEIYDKELSASNIFEIQSEIARAITSNLKAQITESEMITVNKAYTENLQAYEYYLRANEVGIQNDEHEILEAIDLYRSALELDPQFKYAWIQLAKLTLEHYWFSNGDVELINQANTAIESAKTIDDDFSELYVAQGMFEYYAKLNYPKAISYFDKAIAQNPSLSDAYFFKGAALRRDGQWLEAIEEIKKALELDPRQFFSWLQLEESYSLLGDWKNVEKAIQKAEDLVGEHIIVKYHKARVAINQHKDIEAATKLLVATQHIRNKIPNNSYINIQLLARDFDSAVKVAEKFTPNMEIWRQRIFLKEDYLATIYKLKGDIAKAQEYARVSISRLEEIETKFENDYRVYLAKARMYAILDQKQDVLKNIDDFHATRLDDAFENSYQEYYLARIYSLAGMDDLALQQLKDAIKIPTYFHRSYAELDPHFEKYLGKF